MVSRGSQKYLKPDLSLRSPALHIPRRISSVYHTHLSASVHLHSSSPTLHVIASFSTSTPMSGHYSFGLWNTPVLPELTFYPRSPEENVSVDVTPEHSGSFDFDMHDAWHVGAQARVTEGASPPPVHQQITHCRDQRLQVSPYYQSSPNDAIKWSPGYFTTVHPVFGTVVAELVVCAPSYFYAVLKYC